MVKLFVLLFLVSCARCIQTSEKYECEEIMMLNPATEMLEMRQICGYRCTKYEGDK